MGVIHKLKAEVVRFVIDIKKENPDISCRKLVGVVKEKFQIAVSKSSINAIIKTVNLSSPVGRRVKQNRNVSEFKIPDYQRSELFKIPPHLTAIADSNVQSPSNNETPLLMVSDLGVHCEGLGSFFLKAAEWEVCGSSILGNLFRDYKNIEAISDLLMYLKIFEHDKATMINDRDNWKAWKLRSFDQRIHREEIIGFINAAGDPRDLSLKLSNLCSQLFCEINYIRLSLEDGTSLYIDARFNTLCSTSNSSLGAMPLNKASSILSSNFVVNIQPVIIHGIPGKNSWATQFYDFVYAFENIKGKKIVAIGIFDENNNEIVNFFSIPETKRLFIIGGWTSQEELKMLMQKEFKEVKNFYCEVLSREIFYGEFTALLKGTQSTDPLSLKGAAIIDKNKCPILCVLTNIPENKMSIQDVITAYFNKWPSLQQKDIDSLQKVEKNRISQRENHPHRTQIDFWNNIEFLFSVLNQYCQRHFFPSHYAQLDFLAIRDRIYTLNGYLLEKPDILEIIFSVPPKWAFTDDLNYAIKRVNEYQIKNSSGRQLYMRLT